MSYDILDQSTQDSQPAYRFLFSQGSTQWRYTTLPVFISDSAETWEPAPFRASNVTSSNEMAKNGIKISMPRTIGVAQQFLGGVPEDIMTLTVFRDQGRGEADSDLETQVFWKGRVVAVDIGGDDVTLECEDTFTSMRRSGLRARYQKGCRHALYSTLCGVDKNDYGQSVEIISYSGRTITVDTVQDSTLFADSGDSSTETIEDVSATYWVGGFVELANGATRYIVDQVGTTLTLLSPFKQQDMPGSDTVSASIYPGCDRTIQNCIGTFNNVENFGGFPWIPSKNPFRNGVEGSIK